jgi:hypothetical protein
VNHFYTLTVCLILSLCSIAQTTVCLIKGDSVFAGGTNKSRINSVRSFNFVYNGPFDSAVTSEITGTAASSGDFTSFSSSAAQALKDLLHDYFANILQNNPSFFDQQIMGERVSRVVGQICFFAIEDDKPILLNAVYYLNKGVKHPVVISYSIEKQDLAILSSDNRHRYKGIVGHLSEGGGVIEIKKWIGIETGGHIDGTGPPIDVLLLTGNQKIWMRK